METEQLSKIVPAHRITHTIKWCKKNFLPFTEGYRKARARMKKPMDKCFWCRHPFEDGEMIALACIKGKGNKVLCQKCAAPLKGIDP